MIGVSLLIKLIDILTMTVDNHSNDFALPPPFAIHDVREVWACAMMSSQLLMAYSGLPQRTKHVGQSAYVHCTHRIIVISLFAPLIYY